MAPADPTLLARVLASLPSRVFWKDRDSRYLGCNDAFAAQVGLTPAEVVGKTDFDLAPRGEAARYVADDRRVMETGVARVADDERVVLPGGREAVVRISKVPLRDAEGRVTGLVGVFEDVSAQRAAEQQVRAAEARYRAILEQSPLAIQIVGRDGRTRAVNAAWERLFGAPFAALADYDLRSDPQLARQGLLAVVDRAFAGETVAVPESEYDTPATPGAPGDGRKVWVRSVLYGVSGPGGAVDEIVLVHEDLTAGRLADDRARQSAERFARLVEKASEGIAILRRGAAFPFIEFTAWNDRMTAITGYTRDEINRIGVLHALFPDPAALDRALARFLPMRADEDVHGEEWAIRRRDGATVTVAVSTATVTLEDGRPAGLVLVHEVSDHERTKAALALSEQKYHGLFDDSVAATVVADASERITDANRAALDLLGYTREELLALSVRDLLPAPEAEMPTRERLHRAGRVTAHEHGFRRKDGRIVTVLDNLQLLRDAAGDVVGMQATIIDVTERKRAEEERERLRAELEAAQRLDSIGRLAGGVAHDHNNMLGVILGSATGALELLEPDHPAREEIEEVLDAARRSAELTRQLLGFARRQPAQPVTLDVNERLAAAAKMLTRVVREDVRLELAPGEGAPCVHIDPAQLDQILVNLVANARDAIPGAGVIRVETALHTVAPGDPEARTLAPGSYVVLRVRDDGAGMPPEVREHAFEPFFTTKRVGAGTGLGLATVHGIVKQNGGHASIASAPGRGTEVTVLLPAHARPTPTAAPAPSVRRGGHEAILLVEDEPAVLRLVERMLVRLGYEVRSARSPAEALHLARRAETPIDLLVTDVIMPEMSGRALADAIAAERPGLRRLFISGYPADEITQAGLLAPGTAFLQKPFGADALAARVREALGEPAP